jgi:hypothetical protein
MNFSYYIGIKIYGFLIFIASFFSAKAKKRYNGQQEVFSLLEKSLLKYEKTKWVWFMLLRWANLSRDAR